MRSRSKTWVSSSISELPAGRQPLSSIRDRPQVADGALAQRRSTANVVGIIRVWWLIARRAPARSQAAIIASASARVRAIGFSHRMPRTPALGGVRSRSARAAAPGCRRPAGPGAPARSSPGSRRSSRSTPYAWPAALQIGRVDVRQRHQLHVPRRLQPPGVRCGSPRRSPPAPRDRPWLLLAPAGHCSAPRARPPPGQLVVSQPPGASRLPFEPASRPGRTTRPGQPAAARREARPL